MLEITKDWAREQLPKRSEEGHKGFFGKVLAVGGSVGYTGAPYLMAEGAVRGGAGLVRLGVPAAIWPVEAAKAVSAMPFPLADADGKLHENAIEDILDEAARADVVAFGPGLGRSYELTGLVRRLIPLIRQPLVLDADGLYPFRGCPELLMGGDGGRPFRGEAERAPHTNAGTRILTPHDGEFAPLCGCSMEDLRSAWREDLCANFAQHYNVVLVLKGHRTLIAAPDGRIARNTSGNSALAKGGSGDVLTGLIAALLAQKMPAFEAAALGVWLHGRAGELISERYTAYAATPQELLTEGLPAALRELTA